MAQKTEKEETEFKAVPETLTPCINNCGVRGNPSTKNLCQNCFATSASPPSSSSTIMQNSFATSPSASTKQKSTVRSHRSSSPRSSPLGHVVVVELLNPVKEKRDLVIDEAEENFPVKRAVNRCSGCRKKVGLTGFRCRCGEMFCSDHRYSDRHDCSYDYKSAGREAIARENPVVKAAKIVKI